MSEYNNKSFTQMKNPFFCRGVVRWRRAPDLTSTQIGLATPVGRGDRGTEMVGTAARGVLLLRTNAGAGGRPVAADRPAGRVAGRVEAGSKNP